jgi:tRNA pseudouridine55 synthase
VPSARPRGRDIVGLLLLDKPRGLSSNHALQRVKRLYQAAKAGHTGSLDPLATGMLPICFGSATRLSGLLLDARKVYRVTAALGISTTTGDAEGEVLVNRSTEPAPSAARVTEALLGFIGAIDQVPPMYSALKRDGVPLYRLARQGVEVPRESRRVVIEELTLEAYQWPELTLVVRCSKGTYIRTLMEDIAVALGTVGHVAALRRLIVEPFAEAEMHSLDELEALELPAAGGTPALDRLLLPAARALHGWASVHVPRAAALRLGQGQALPAEPAWPMGPVAVYAEPNDFVAIAEVTPDGRLLPKRVFLR